MWLKKAVVIAAVGATGFLVHSMLFFDPDEFVRDHEARAIAEVVAGRAPIAENELARRARWHVGQPPCFTYAPPDVTADEIESIVADFATSGSAGLAASNLTLFADWSVADERLRDGEPSEEEILSAYGDLSWYRRLLLTLNRTRIFETSLRRMRQREKESRERSAQREAELSPEQVSELRTIWQTHRLKLPIAALLPLKRALQRSQNAASQ